MSKGYPFKLVRFGDTPGVRSFNVDHEARVNDYGPTPAMPLMVTTALSVLLKTCGKVVEQLPEGRARGQLEAAVEVVAAHFSRPAPSDDASPFGIPRPTA